MNMQPVKSSQVESIGYDAATKTLAVKFKSGGTYHYSDVPPETHAACLTCESVGKYLHANIKGKHPHKKVG